MPEISIQKQCASLTDLIDTESFGEPIGELPRQTDSGFFEAGNLFAGTWQCEPGKTPARPGYHGVLPPAEGTLDPHIGIRTGD